MFDAILNGLSGLGAGFFNMHWSNPVMIAVGCLLRYLGIKKDVEPLLLVPIGGFIAPKGLPFWEPSCWAIL